MNGTEQPARRATPADVARPEPAPDEVSNRVWTLPNVLSLIRLTGAPLMLYLIVGPQADAIAVLVLALGGFTDWLDGFLARRWHQITRLGQLLDPIADRLYIVVVLIGLAWREIIPWWLLVVLVARDLLLAVLIPVLRTRGLTVLPVHFIGKVATFCLLYAFPLVLLGSDETGWLRVAWVLGWAFAVWGTALYWYAGLLYLAETGQVLRTTRHR